MDRSLFFILLTTLQLDYAAGDVGYFYELRAVKAELDQGRTNHFRRNIDGEQAYYPSG